VGVSSTAASSTFAPKAVSSRPDAQAPPPAQGDASAAMPLMFMYTAFDSKSGTASDSKPRVTVKARPQSAKIAMVDVPDGCKVTQAWYPKGGVGKALDLATAKNVPENIAHEDLHAEYALFQEMFTSKRVSGDKLLEFNRLRGLMGDPAVSVGLDDVGNALDEMIVDSDIHDSPADWLDTPLDLEEPMDWYDNIAHFRPSGGQPMDEDEARQRKTDELLVEEYDLYTAIINKKGGSAKDIDRLRELRALNAPRFK
jgi:hypothetical protein